MKKYSTVFFDLFDTLVMFEPSLLPEITVNGKTWNTTAQGVFNELGSSFGDMEFSDFCISFLESHKEIMKMRKKNLREYPNSKRFEILLERTGMKKDENLINNLVSSHMESLCTAVIYPESHTDILSYLRDGEYRLCVVSNFDHAPTALKLLEKFGISEFFEQVVVSEEVGWRKPHPEIFKAALDRMNEEPSNTVFVGDNPEADIAGSAECGMDSVWVKRREQTIRANPLFTINDLSELKGII